MRRRKGIAGSLSTGRAPRIPPGESRNALCIPLSCGYTEVPGRRRRPMEERAIREREARGSTGARRDGVVDENHDPRGDRVVETGIDREAQHDEYGGFNFGA